MADRRITTSEGVLAIHHSHAHAGEQPVFYYDFASPEAYLAAEQMAAGLPVMPEWQPVAMADLTGDTLDGWRCGEERDIYMSGIERRAAALGLQPLRWPDRWPSDTHFALRAATYAKQIGRVVAFSLAAFRQAFAGGRELADPDNVLIAAAACELHPAAVLQGAALRSVDDDLTRATEAARAGLVTVPSVRVGAEVFSGERAIEEAARALRARGAAA